MPYKNKEDKLAASKRWREAHPEKAKAAARKSYHKRKAEDPEKVRSYARQYYQDRPGLASANHLKYKYGLSPNDIPDTCQVCGRNDIRICVDHDHETGKVRGFLCTNCNTALGQVRDDRAVLHNLIAYLDEWEKKNDR
jgi:hypothetical protein